MSRSPSPPRRSETVAARFRREIEAAAGEGAEREGMVLKLTLSDTSRLRRDATVAVADISFAGGAMHYLGVVVESGGIAESALSIGADAA
jgi:hypothetical protein